MNKGKGSKMVRPKLCLKLIVFTSIPGTGEENVKCRAGQWARPGLTAAVLKLKWHFLSEAFPQTALFCPFTCNLRDTQTAITKNKSGHLKHTAVIEQTDLEFNMGEDSWCEHASWWRYQSKWEIDFSDISVAAIQRGWLKAPNSARSLYFTCSEMYASVILHQSKRKGLGIACFNFPHMMKRYIDSGQGWNLDHIITLLTS